MIALGVAVAAATRARTEFEGGVRARHRDQRQQRDQADRREVAQRVVACLRQEDGTDAVRERADHQRVAVRRLAGDGFGRDQRVRARPVLDDDRLAERRRHVLRDDARDDVGGAAGGETDD